MRTAIVNLNRQQTGPNSSLTQSVRLMSANLAAASMPIVAVKKKKLCCCREIARYFRSGSLKIIQHGTIRKFGYGFLYLHRSFIISEIKQDIGRNRHFCSRNSLGDAKNAAVENAGVENVEADRRGGI